MKRITISCLFTVVGCCGLSARAATIYVDRNLGNDSWDGLCETYDGGSCGPKRSLVGGLSVAAAGDTVLVKDGLYDGTFNRNIYIPPDFDVTIRCANATEEGCTILLTEPFQTHRAFCIEDNSTVIDGFVFFGGKAPTADVCIDGIDTANKGGALFYYGSSGDDSQPVIRNCTFDNCQAGSGGALYFWNTDATVEDCRFDSCSATSAGGAIYNTQGTPTYRRDTFDGCSSQGQGGAIFQNGSVLSEYLLFLRCQAPEGGAVYADTGNDSTIWHGCIFGENVATVSGSALVVKYKGAVYNGLFYRNDGRGCIYTPDNGRRDVYLSHCTLAYNTNTQILVADDTDLYIHNSLIYRASSSDEVFERIAGDGTESYISVAYSRLPDDAMDDIDDDGGGNVGDSPRFVDPSVDDYRLREVSTLVDAANADLVPPGVTTDLLRAPRFVDYVAAQDRGHSPDGSAIPDMGAFELQEQVGRVLYVNAAKPPGRDGSSWVNPFADLNVALESAADQNGVVDEIWVAGGTYRPAEPGGNRSATFPLQSGVALYGGFAGNEERRSQRDQAVNVTILSGDLNGDDTTDFGNTADNVFRVVSADNVDAPTLLDGFTVTGGNATGTGTNNVAAGINVSAGSLRIVRCRVIENQATYGAGIRAVNGSDVLLVNCLLAGNRADIWGGGIVVNASSLEAVNTLIVGNRAGRGGGIFTSVLGGGYTVRAVNCTISANVALLMGGGVYTDAPGVHIANSILWLNAPDQIGGTGNPDVTYSDILGGWSGTGNIEDDPLFLNFGGTWQENDYRLDPSSPCIDRGSNSAVPADGGDLDGDGNRAETISRDLDLNVRFGNNPAVPDNGQGTAPIVDMGPYEGAPCICDVLEPPTDIAERVDYDAMAEGGVIAPPTSAFLHTKVPCDPNEGCTRSDENGNPIKSAVFASVPDETGAVTITWKYRDDDDVLQEHEETYGIGTCVNATLVENTPPYHIATTRYFKSYPEATVFVTDLYEPTIHYNSTIEERLPENEDDPAEEPHIEILSGGQVNVNEDCPEGMVVIQYDQYLGGPLIGFELLTITAEGASSGGQVDIGRNIWNDDDPPGGTDGCRAMLVRNMEVDGVTVAYQRAADSHDVYPIRPETDAYRFIVAWYQSTPLDNCWPGAMLRYTTDWPDDPQRHIIDSTAERNEIPAGVQVDARPDKYCGVEVMYQEPFIEGAAIPYAHVNSDKAFAARNEGYAVVRFDYQPDEVSPCGEEVFFEVVTSYDRTASQVYDPTYDKDVAWSIGDQLTCRNGQGDTENLCFCAEDDCRTSFDEEAATFPFGFLYVPSTQTSAPYAVDIYADTGQIFPVNKSAGGHGSLEAWWYEESRYVPGTYWPHKVVTYTADWTRNDGDVVIASRGGAGSYPDGARIYDTGTVADAAEPGAGWNPNDEHAILLPVGGRLRAYAARTDEHWKHKEGVSVSGHPWVLVEYPDPADQTLWKMGVRQVFATSAEHDFTYASFLVVDGDCGCFDGVCGGGYSEGASCTTDDDCVCEAELPVYAGLPIDPLYPVNFGAAKCRDEDGSPATYVVPITGEALWVDNKGGIWAAEGNSDESPYSPSEAEIYIWENWGADYGCQPWLQYGPDGEDDTRTEPWPVIYQPGWPEHEYECVGAEGSLPGKCRGGDSDGASCFSNSDCGCAYPDDAGCSPLRHVGETVDRTGNCGTIQVLHDTVGVRVIDPSYEVGVDWDDANTQFDFVKLPPHIYHGEIGGGGDWPDRIRYDAGSKQLLWRGVMSEADYNFLLDKLDPENENTALRAAIATLRKESRAQVGVCDADGSFCTSDSDCSEGTCVEELVDGEMMQVSMAHPDALKVHGRDADDGRWVSFALQNDQECVDENLPISVEVWRVECPPYQGRIVPIYPQCPLSEMVVLQFSGDGGGDPTNLYFQWQWSIDYDSISGAGTWNDYSENGGGLREVLIEGGSDVFALIDTYWRVRYRGYVGCGCTEGENCNENDPDDPDPYGDWNDNWGGLNTEISDWADVQLVEGWVKRVIRGINAFDQRVEEFHENDPATYVDMIRQAGKRYVEPVALNCDPDNIDGVGLIELYETVLARAIKFSLEAGIYNDAVGKALLLAAGKIADFNMLLANEAYADALDPTIGVFAQQGEPSGAYDPRAAFAFEEQVISLLEEELALLRGQDRQRPLDYDADGVILATVDNRLPWNFTSGNGQIAYANNYQLIDVEEAVETYPQGHGDAWGYFLTAENEFFSLLNDSVFEWVVAHEDVLVSGQIVPVGFKYERKFAQAAAGKARAGAAVAALTFRERYTNSQWDRQRGFPDGDSDRAWGVEDWTARAGQGAYLDWALANALLPELNPGACSGMVCSDSRDACGTDDDCPNGEICIVVMCNDDSDCYNGATCDAHEFTVKQIDRGTVSELPDIAGAFAEIQSIADEADAGMNPLGVSANVVPFGLDPSELADGRTHFDQVLQRALAALSNAATAFDYANANTQRLRLLQDDVDNFEDLIEEQESGYTSQLIEVFGRPYPEDDAYPASYGGPDIWHFEYMDDSPLYALSELEDAAAGGTTTINVKFAAPDFSDLGDHTSEGFEGAIDEWTVEFNVSTNGLGLVKPSNWSRRPAVGEIQLARSDLLQLLGRYLQSLENYDSLLTQVQEQASLLSDLYGLSAHVLSVMTEGREEQRSLSEQIRIWRAGELLARKLGNIAMAAGNAWAEALPTSVGLSNDISAPLRSTIRLIATGVAEAFYSVGDGASWEQLKLQHDKELVSLDQQIEITGLQNDYQEDQQVIALKQLIRAVPPAIVDLYTTQEALQQSTSRYKSAIERGLRLWDQRSAYRARTADRITKHRYRDMAFRIYRNDALQKYRAQFDLAARYAYLAAKAYDYESNLLGDDPLSGGRILTRLVRERSLGVVQNGIPYSGPGLAGVLAQLASNYEVLRGELGINAEDKLTRTFHLRWEAFRVSNAVGSDGTWRELFDNVEGSGLPFVIADLNEWQPYRDYCQPLLPITGAEPAIVIPLQTTLSTGLNLFGQSSTGDEILPPDRYAVKIHSTSVRFAESYPSPPLNRQVHVYLIPAGVDIMRVPTDGATTRSWTVLDQVLPMPFPVTHEELRQPDWMPWDAVAGGSAAMAHRRRLSTLTACPVTNETCDPSYVLAGRSIWNDRWYLVIPGSQLMGDDPAAGIDVFINGEDADYPNGVRDVELQFELYGYKGTAGFEPPAAP